jgi:hypothetical protein
VCVVVVVVVVGGGGTVVTVVWRVVVVLVVGSLEQDTSIKPAIDRAEMRVIDFFIV